MDANQNWLTVREVATELQVHEETVRRWIRSGELPAIELGGPRAIYRIRPAALGTFMRQRTHGQTVEVEREPAPSPRTADFRQLVEKLPMVTFVFDPGAPSRRGSLNYISPEVEQIFGLPVDEWYDDLDKVWPKLMTPEQYERVISLSERMRATSEHYSLDIRMVNHLTGAPVWVSLDMELERNNPEGKEIWYGLLVDITERKRLEEHLHTHIQALGSLASRLIAVMSLESMIFEVLRDLPRAVPVRLARLRVAGAGGRVLTTYALRWNGQDAPDFRDMDISRGDLPTRSLTQQVLQGGAALRVGNLERDRRFSGERSVLREGLRSALAVPVRDQVRIVAVLEAFADEEEAFLVSDRAFLEALASVAALALARQGERWLTVPAVAEMLDVQPETVRRWIRQGELVAAMPGGVRAGYRVDAAQLDAFIQRRQSHHQSAG